MIDQYGRTIDYLRISVTDRCNLRCQYCMPEEEVCYTPAEELLSDDEILMLCQAFASLGLRKIKLTGGEPLLRQNIGSLIRNIKQIKGIEQVTMTTNGICLNEQAEELAMAGIDGINISLDTLNKESFAAITKRDQLEEVLEGLEAARSYRIPVKINCVPLYTSLEDIVSLVALTKQNIHVRFIEVMPIGCGKKKESYQEDEIKRIIAAEYGPLEEVTTSVGNGPCHYYSIDGSSGYVGFISAMSHKFCSSCNRVRLTSTGYLKTCLQYELGTDLKQLLRNHASMDALRDAIVQTIGKKPEAHAFDQEHVAGEETNIMARIGG